MKIHWLLGFKIADLNSIKEANLASVRLRLGSLIQKIDNSAFEVQAGENIINNPEILIVGKLKSLNNQSTMFWIDKIRLAKNNGSKIIIDYTENHLYGSDSFYKSLYEELIPYADEAVVSSSLLKLQLATKFKNPIKIIEDAIEVSLIKPKIKNSNYINILWFGHASNINYLISFINNWNNLKNKTVLHILCNENGLAFLNQIQFNTPQNLSIQTGIWSIEAMENAANFCDLAIIPSDLNDSKKAGASSNRLITALALGLPTAADMIDSYKEFDKYFVDIRSENFTNLLEDPNPFHNLVSEAQEKIVPRFTKEVIGEKWINFFDSLSKVN
jgi:hypothetical protein